MDPTTPSSSPPSTGEPPPIGPGDTAAGAIPAVPKPPAPRSANERRLLAKLGPDERCAAWGRGWVSRDGKLHTLFAARTFDFMVVTDDHLIFFATGFLSRRPRRRVFDIPLDRLTIGDRRGRGTRRLRIWSRAGGALLLELRANKRNTTFADALVARIDRPDGA
jgi:hypothetical protein